MTTENKLVSIIVPVYNAERYLERCWSSLKNQTYSNLEIIFINDASTDGSLACLEEIQKEDDRVVVINQSRNMGVSAARNAGLDVCRGEYIGFCDSDDCYKQEYVEAMVSALEDRDADMACCALNRIRDDLGAPESLWAAPEAFTMTPEEAVRNWLCGKYVSNSVYTKLSKKDLWEGIRFPEGEIFEEAYVIPQLLSRAKKVVHTGKSLYVYYYGHQSLTSAPMNQRILPVFKREEYIREYVQSRFRGMEDAVMCFEVRTNLGCMIGAELSKKGMDAGIYQEVKYHFDRIFSAGLFNPYVSVKDKLHLIEVKTKLFYLRKKMAGQLYSGK